MPGRSFTSSLGSRYGFNGKEKDGNGEWGSTLSNYDYGFRIYNPSVAKFLSVDPLRKSYPWYTPYQFAGNMPIWAIDLDGAEPTAANYARAIATVITEHPDAEGIKRELLVASYATFYDALDVTEFTDVNDAAVIVTTFTRGEDAITINGKPATGLDKTFAFGGAMLPFISGSAFKRGWDVLFGKSDEVATGAKESAEVFDELIDDGIRSVDQPLTKELSENPIEGLEGVIIIE